MPLNPSDQGTYDKIKQNLIDTVDPFDIMPSLVDVFTRQDRQMLTQTTKDLGSRFGMMELLDKYENKAKNLHPLINALKQANYSIECFFNDEPASGSEQTSNVEAGSLTVSELKEQIKFMQEEMKGMQTELGHMKSAKDGEKAQKEIKQLRKDLKNMEIKLEQQQIKENTNYEGAMARHSTSEDNPSSSFNYETTSTTKIGGLQFPSKSILLVGGSSRDMEVYCTEDESKSRDLRINSRIPRFHHVGCKIGPEIIISGGYNGGSLKSTEFFDIQTGQWSDGPDMNKGRLLAMSAAIGDTFFVFGGKPTFGTTSAEKLQIPSSTTWKSIKDLPHKFYSGNAVAVDDQIYIIGEKTNWLLLPGDMSSLIYVPAYDKYLTTIPLIKGRKDFFASTLLNDNTIVVTGGTSARTQTSCQMLDLRTKKWEPLSDMNIARYVHQLVNVDEKLYAIGGRGNNYIRLSSVETYDIRNQKWMKVHPIKQPRDDFTAFAM